MKSVLYVSKANLSEANAGEVVSQIVAVSRERNARLDVTGMLIFTGDHFAQVLEGPEAGLDLLMPSIRRDERHHSLQESAQRIETRSFGEWRMGYDGQSTYVDRLIRALFDPASKGGSEEARVELQELMLLLAHKSAKSSLAST